MAVVTAETKTVAMAGVLTVRMVTVAARVGVVCPWREVRALVVTWRGNPGVMGARRLRNPEVPLVCRLTR